MRKKVLRILILVLILLMGKLTLECETYYWDKGDDVTVGDVPNIETVKSKYQNYGVSSGQSGWESNWFQSEKYEIYKGIFNNEGVCVNPLLNNHPWEEYLRCPWIDKDSILCRQRRIYREQMTLDAVNYGAAPQIYYYQKTNNIFRNNTNVIYKRDDNNNPIEQHTFWWDTFNFEKRRKFDVNSKEAIILNLFDTNYSTFIYKYAENFVEDTLECRRDMLIQLFFLEMFKDEKISNTEINFIKNREDYKTNYIGDGRIFENTSKVKEIYDGAKEIVDEIKTANDSVKDLKVEQGSPNSCFIGDEITLELSSRRYFRYNNSDIKFNMSTQSCKGFKSNGTIADNVELSNAFASKDNPVKSGIGSKTLYDIDDLKEVRVEDKIKVNTSNDKKFTIEVGEEFDANEFYIIIPCRYMKFEGYYDLYKGGGNYIIDPGERKTVIEKCIVKKVTIKPAVTINQYISKVEESGAVQYIQEKNNKWKLMGTANRASWTNAEKKSKPAILENGMEITYTVQIKNEGNADAKVKFTEKLPSCFKGQKITIVKKDSSNNREYTRVIDSLTSENQEIKNWYKEDGGYENKAFKVPANKKITFTITGKISTDDRSNYYEPDTPVRAWAKITSVKYGELIFEENEINQVSSDYFILRKYCVEVKTYIRYIFRHKEGKTGHEEDYHIRKDNEYVAEKGYEPESTLTEEQKNELNSDVPRYRKNQMTQYVSDEENKNHPVYIENGDEVDYNIRIRNMVNENGPYYTRVEADDSNIRTTVRATARVKLPKNAEILSIMQSNSLQDVNKQWVLYDSQNQQANQGKYQYEILGNKNDGFEVIIYDMGWMLDRSDEPLGIYPIDTIGEKSASFYIRVRMNSNSNEKSAFSELKEATSEIIGIKNEYGMAQGKVSKTSNSNNHIINQVTDKQRISREYCRIKDYNVGIDKYIQEVKHQDNLKTYESDGRKSTITVSNGVGTRDNIKNNEPVSVEYGDRVTYKIRIFNTTESSDYNVGNRLSQPYKSPQYVYVDMKDTLPEHYSGLQIGGIEQNNYTINGNTIDFSKVKVERGSVKEITVSFVVEDVTKNTIGTNTISIKENGVRNINQFLVTNHSKRLSAFDKYQLNDYKLGVDEYISRYDAQMHIYNLNHGFITKEGEQEGFSGSTKSYSTGDSALLAEKYETLTFTTKVTNNAKLGSDRNTETENNTGAYGKYPTRVRPTTLTQRLADGLERIGNTTIEWYDVNHNRKMTIPARNIQVSQKREGTDIVFDYNFNMDEVILEPGEYLLYTTQVIIRESNLYSGLLRSQAEVSKITNINKNTSNERDVTAQNIDTKKSDVDFVRLKDTVIAGTVWLDENQNGLRDSNETGKPGIKVKLYRDDGVLVAETTTKTEADVQNNGGKFGVGFYTFGRRPKYDIRGNVYKYYVEFEYDGLKYKATEIYGGDSDGEADGMHNLGGVAGSSTWRQGYDDLGGNIAGDRNYMIDSNAYEFDDDRNNFNNNYQIIGFNKAYRKEYYSNPHGGQGSHSSHNPHGSETETQIVSTGSLEYDKQGHISTLKEVSSDRLEQDSSRKVIARSFIDQSNRTAINKGAGNTHFLFLYNYDGYSNRIPETEYLKFINLGLVQRNDADVSLEADVNFVKTMINGEEMRYMYGTNTANSTKYQTTDSSYNHANDYRLAEAYQLDLYSTDYNYRVNEYYENDMQGYKGEESELNVEVTYRVRLVNDSLNDAINTAINELAIYYDKNFIANPFEQVTVKRKNETTGMLENSTTHAIRAFYGTKDELNRGAGNALMMDVSSRNGEYGNQVPGDLDEKEYNIMYLSGMEEHYIPKGQDTYVEITFTIDKENKAGLERALKITEDEDMGLEMICEISAYTTKYADDYKKTAFAGQYAGLIDRDSNPGNLGLNGSEEYNYYEDDTYKAGIKMGLLDKPDNPDNPDDSGSPERNLAGIVWDDARTEVIQQEDGSEVQYVGDGVYDPRKSSIAEAKKNPDKECITDMPVEGVKVSLIEMIQRDNKYFEYPAEYTYDVYENGKLIHHKGDKIETRTDNEGLYQLNHFIPGYYKVRFDYGDFYKVVDPATGEETKYNTTYNGQDYKSTTYYNNQYYTHYDSASLNTIGSVNNNSYFQRIKDSLTYGKDGTQNNIVRSSDAQDDEIRRLNVNSYSETMTALQAVVFSEKEKNEERLCKNTKMYAESVIFYVKPEEIRTMDGNKIYPEDEKYKENGVNKFNEKRLWNIKALDFGLQYRPEASIILDKEIAKVELITSDNQVLVRLNFKEENEVRVIDKNTSIGYENVQFLPNKGKTEQGFVYINMDTEILQGCTVNIEYELETQNNSEVDRVNKNLDAIKYELGANDYSAKYKVYTKENVGSNDENIEFIYNANATAAQLLAEKYYDGYEYKNGEETYNFLKHLKKSYKSLDPDDNKANETEIDGVTLTGEEYYGIYLGETYYTGKIGKDDVVAELKVDHILDYVDNDFTFDQRKNNSKDKLWAAMTSKELYDNHLLNWNKVHIERDKNGKPIFQDKDQQKYYSLIDRFGMHYDRESGSNLQLSVDDNKNGTLTTKTNRDGNVSLSRFLKTNKQELTKDEYTGKIRMSVSKVLSGDDVSIGKSLSYENMAEVVQYTTLTGRRTTLPNDNGGGIIGNATTETWNGVPPEEEPDPSLDINPPSIQKLSPEDDTDATEIITISPPTGLIE